MFILLRTPGTDSTEPIPGEKSIPLWPHVKELKIPARKQCGNQGIDSWAPGFEKSFPALKINILWDINDWIPYLVPTHRYSQRQGPWQYLHFVSVSL
jgi:hypothetical protein